MAKTKGSRKTAKSSTTHQAQTKATSKAQHKGPSSKSQQPTKTPISPARQARKKKRGHGWTRKKTHLRPPPHPDNYRFDPLRRYKIRGITAEDDGMYTIEWARTDSKGNKFRPSKVPVKEFAKKGRKYANNAAVRDWKKRVAQGREDEFNDAPGEYDTEGEEYVTEASEDEMEESLKFRKKAEARKRKGRN